MEFKEIELKNFGKFHNEKLTFSGGINVIFGENESGKSTVHTAIKGLLFGMERGRGKAAKNDTFSAYEPWENPNYYAGKLTLISGGKEFVIDRHFDKVQKSASFVCATDGEELSLADGDLAVILDNISESSFEDTISIGQLKAKPGNTLATELSDYASNYYVTGDSNLNLSKAVKQLEEEKKNAIKKLRKINEEQEKERGKKEQESSFVWREICDLEEKIEELEGEIEHKNEMEEEVVRPNERRMRSFDEVRPGKWRVHPLEILLFVLIVVAVYMLFPVPWSYLTSIVITILSGIYIWNRMKEGKYTVKSEYEIMLEAIAAKEEQVPLEKMYWELGHLKEELKEKQVQYENLQEQLEEIAETSQEAKELFREQKAVELAIERIGELTKAYTDRLRIKLNEETSDIIAAITGGKYDRLIVEEDLSLFVLTDGRRVPIERLSQGTIEQLYFALRMAAAEILFEEPLPLIFDDAFVNYDDERLAAVLSWLSKQDRQVLLFTCQNREKEMLQRWNIPHQLTILNSIE